MYPEAFDIAADTFGLQRMASDIEMAVTKVPITLRIDHQLPDIHCPERLSTACGRVGLLHQRSWARQPVVIACMLWMLQCMIAIGIMGLSVPLLAANAEPEGQQFPRLLQAASESAFDNMEIVAPLLLLITAAVVNCCAAAGGVMFGADSSVLGYAMKMLFVDSVDQLVSIYLVIWCHMTTVGDGIRALAWFACIFGLPSFFGSTFAMQAFMKGASDPMRAINLCGFIADIFSLAAMGVIEFTAVERDLLPGWLKGLDLLWSVASIIAEIAVIVRVPGSSASEDKSDS
jgi:hypothetical protein